MHYISTRGEENEYNCAQAIKRGLASDGGLFVPAKIPFFTQDIIKDMAGLSYKEIASLILHPLLDDFTYQEISGFLESAYTEEKFGEEIAPLVQLNKYNDREHILELWHGPTAAFKDIALQLLPHLMKASMKKLGDAAKVCILTATSGDTGKAALEGFKDVEDTFVIVYYPQKGVSEMQKLQMITQDGSNCSVIAVEGCFDDAQSGVKTIFSDEQLKNELESRNILLSSANSINWGRLAPQIVYYFSSYAKLLKDEKIELGEKVNFVVPTGNFGNILSAWYAMKMGLPVNKLICASNRNKVLSDFFRNGIYDRNRPFHKTNSPSMDILISSNLERLLFEITGRDPEKVRGWMNSLNTKGNYTVDPLTLKKIQETFVGGFSDEAGTIKTIRDVYDKCDHCVDTHTAVGFNVYERYLTRSKDESKTIFVSTASPFKFPGDVSDAIFGKGYQKGRSEEVLLRELSEEIGLKIPQSLNGIFTRPVLHNKETDKNSMKRALLEVLQKEN